MYILILACCATAVGILHVLLPRRLTIVALSGPPGTGKSTLARCMREMGGLQRSKDSDLARLGIQRTDPHAHKHYVDNVLGCVKERVVATPGHHVVVVDTCGIQSVITEIVLGAVDMLGLDKVTVVLAHPDLARRGAFEMAKRTREQPDDNCVDSASLSNLSRGEHQTDEEWNRFFGKFYADTRELKTGFLKHVPVRVCSVLFMPPHYGDHTPNNTDVAKRIVEEKWDSMDLVQSHRPNVSFDVDEHLKTGKQLKLVLLKDGENAAFLSEVAAMDFEDPVENPCVNLKFNMTRSELREATETLQEVEVSEIFVGPDGKVCACRIGEFGHMTVAGKNLREGATVVKDPKSTRVALSGTHLLRFQRVVADNAKKPYVPRAGGPVF